MVAGVGIEPTRTKVRQILSLLRLPIPPSGQLLIYLVSVGTAIV